MVAIADKDKTVKKVVEQQIITIITESMIPASPVIYGTLINKSTPKIFCITGKNTPNKVPYLEAVLTSF